MKPIPEKYHDLLKDETKAFAYLATNMKDGTPQVTPLWFNWDGKYIWINSAVGRAKDQNMRERPAVAIVISDPHDPYRYLQIRGRVVEITEEGAREHIDALSLKYWGRDYAQTYHGETRVKYKIEPEHVTVSG
jgi:PPOX class probable F420-dependent enzyme